MDGYLTVQEVARRYGVIPRTVRGWCARGYLPGALQRIVGGRTFWLIPPEAPQGFTPPTPGRPNRVRDHDGVP